MTTLPTVITRTEDIIQNKNNIVRTLENISIQEQQEQKQEDIDVESHNERIMVPVQVQQQKQQILPHPHSIPKFITPSYRITTTTTTTSNTDPSSSLHNDTTLNIFLQIYLDRIVVGISQYEDGRIGNYLLCQSDLNQQDAAAAILSSGSSSSKRREQQQQQQQNDPSTSNSIRNPHYHVTTLLGVRDDPLLALYARTIWDALHLSTTNQALLLGISLQPPSTTATQKDKKELFHTIIQLIVQLYEEAILTTTQ